MLLIDLLKQFLKSISIVKSNKKKHFNKNLILSEKEEKQFRLSNTCWICEKLIDYDDDDDDDDYDDDDDQKVRDHCHVTSKFRGAFHWSL